MLIDLNMNKNKQYQQLIEKYNSYPAFDDIDLTDPNQPGRMGDTLLHLVAYLGAAEEIDVLIASGAHINILGDMGQTPLHNAATRGRCEAVKRLLALGADPTIRDEFGKTPADTAAIFGYVEIAQILRKAAESSGAQC